MMQKTYFILLSFLGFTLSLSYAQSPKDSVEVSLEPYVSLRGHLAVYDEQMELQENASKIGMRLSAGNNRVSFIAGTEVQLNMFKGSSSFNVDGDLAGGFLVVQPSQTQQVFGNRLGYLGIDLHKYGTVTFGKQWGVYRDITSYTDQFSVFGRRASATFIGGTDGGEGGTGRADQAIIYRNHFGPVSLGAQMQARNSNKSRFIDGYGLSSQIQVTKEFLIGLAYNRAFLNEPLINNHQVIGLTGNPVYFSFGTKYNSDKIDFGFILIHQKNGDFTQGELVHPTLGTLKPTVVYDANGAEVFGKYKFQKYALLLGYNLYVPETNITSIPVGNDLPINSKFRTSDLISGIIYQPVRPVQIYAEQRVSFGRTALGKKEPSVFTLGLKLDIAKQYNSTMFF